MTMTKRKMKVSYMLSILLIGMCCLSGCKKNEATKAAKESDATEREGQGQEEEKVTQETVAETVPSSKGTVGLLLPCGLDDEEYHRQEGELRRILTDAGYTLVTRYAKNDPLRQEAQLNMFTQEDVSLILVDAVDQDTFGEVMHKLEDRGLPPVIAYRKLVMYTDKLKYFVTYDMRQIGHQIASEIISRSGMDNENEEAGQETKTIELFMEGPVSADGLFLFNGIIEGLSPYFESGRLSCVSGKLSYQDALVHQENQESVTDPFALRTQEYYPEGEIPDIVFTSSANLAEAAAEFFKNKGYSYLPKSANGLFSTPSSEAVSDGETENTTQTADIYSFAETEYVTELTTQEETQASLTRSINEILSDAQAIVTGVMQTDWPLIASVGVPTDLIHLMQDGAVSFSVFLDERTLAQTLAKLSVSYLSDEEIEVSDYQQYDNGTKLISTVISPAQIIDADNYQILVDNGYYEQYQIGYGSPH